MISRESITDLEVSKLLDIAKDETLFLPRSWALEELSRRSLHDDSILDEILPIIGREIRVKTRSGVPVGAKAALILVDENSDDINRRIAESMNGWEYYAQSDFFTLVMKDSDGSISASWVRNYGLNRKTNDHE